jgi:hypothetical protein
MSRKAGLTLFHRFLRGAPVISLLVAMPALAAGKQAMLSQEQAARKACLNGDYAKGTSILSDLFVQSGGNPVFIFNQDHVASRGIARRPGFLCSPSEGSPWRA